ncbi:MAG: DUF2510 domain-containing protein [Acidimicrobiaceae bacterium]|nr:DUF2510 domain-containing protein [Acidimicrobiaceae bacterium]
MRDSNKRPPGWYVDPKNSKQWRYWDGGRWTNHYEPRDPQFPDLAPIRLPSLSQDRDPPPKPRTSPQKTENNKTTTSSPPYPVKATKEAKPKTGPPTTKATPSETPLATKAASSTVVPKTTTSSVPSETHKQPGWHADTQDGSQWLYWNGSEWVESRSPQQSHEAEHETPPGSSQSAAIKKTLNWRTPQGFVQWWQSLKPSERIAVAICASIIFISLWFEPFLFVTIVLASATIGMFYRRSHR